MSSLIQQSNMDTSSSSYFVPGTSSGLLNAINNSESSTLHLPSINVASIPVELEKWALFRFSAAFVIPDLNLEEESTCDDQHENEITIEELSEKVEEDRFMDKLSQMIMSVNADFD